MVRDDADRDKRRSAGGTCSESATMCAGTIYQVSVKYYGEVTPLTLCFRNNNDVSGGLIKNQLEKSLAPCASPMKWYNNVEQEFRNW